MRLTKPFILVAAGILSSATLALAQEPEHRLEWNLNYSSLPDVPGATSYTAFCGKVCRRTIPKGPAANQMYGTGVAYTISSHLGIYGDFGITRTVKHSASETRAASQGVSSTSASRSLMLLTTGTFVTKATGVLRPYAYAGAGIVNDSYSFSTAAITNRSIGFPGIFDTTIEIGPSSKKIKADFQFGLGLRLHVGQRHGVRFFGELNTPASGLEEVRADPDQGSDLHHVFSRFGIGYFVQLHSWR
jgi:hypothetical protein